MAAASICHASSTCFSFISSSPSSSSQRRLIRVLEFFNLDNCVFGSLVAYEEGREAAHKGRANRREDDPVLLLGSH